MKAFHRRALRGAALAGGYREDVYRYPFSHRSELNAIGEFIGVEFNRGRLTRSDIRRCLPTAASADMGSG